MSFKQRFDGSANRHVDVAEHHGTCPRGAELAAGIHGGLAGHELSLARGTFPFRIVIAIHWMTFRENRRHDFMTAVHIVNELRHKLRITVAQPQMMLRVDDRKIGPQNVLL